MIPILGSAIYISCSTSLDIIVSWTTHQENYQERFIVIIKQIYHLYPVTYLLAICIGTGREASCLSWEKRYLALICVDRCQLYEDATLRCVTVNWFEFTGRCRNRFCEDWNSLYQLLNEHIYRLKMEKYMLRVFLKVIILYIFSSRPCRL